MRKLNPKTAAVWAFIADHADRHTYAPDFREIGVACGIRSVSDVKRHIDILAAAGVLSYQFNRARTIDLHRKPKGRAA